MLREGLADRGVSTAPPPSATHGRHARCERGHRRLGLQHAERGLAALREELGDRLTQRALDLAVEVDEPRAEPLRRPARPSVVLPAPMKPIEREVPV